MASKLQLPRTSKLDLTVSHIIDNPKFGAKQQQRQNHKLQLSPKCKATEVRLHGKRRYSCNGDGKSSAPFKRRHKGSVPPTKFLLGGNINDPLNLGSLADEEINRSLNEVTPYSSPVPLPTNRNRVEVLIPPNINDPLNLNAGDDEVELNLVSPKTRRRKNRKRKKHGSGETSGVDEKGEDLGKPEDEEEETSAERLSDESHRSHKQKRLDGKIVSPVIPQQVPRKRGGTHSKSLSKESDLDKELCSSKPESKGLVTSVKRPHTLTEAELKAVKFRSKDVKFQYGNYNRYYGYRNMNLEEDPRLKCMHRDWFNGKDVLDLGCNVGFFTFSIAKDFGPRKIIGLDIDYKLIAVAKKNIRHYVSSEASSDQFPISLPILFGPVAVTSVGAQKPHFPNNVMFLQGNYVLESDELLETQQSEFDTILCLSLTKWIHLNWGDDGLKRVFKRIYAQLRPGGRLILEAQAWQSYARKKKLTETTYRHYSQIQLRPEQFTEYLLSREVGFSTCEVIDTPFNLSKGFRRPIQLFTKGEVLTKGEARSTSEDQK